MARSDSSMVAVLLTQRLVDGSAEPLKASEFWALVDRVGDLKMLVGLGVDALAGDVGLGRELAVRVAALLDAATQVAFAVDDAEQAGLRVVAAVDDDYPARLVEALGSAAPPVLYAAGDLELLRRGGLAVVGSGEGSPEAGEVAREAGTRAAAAGVPVVSGGSRGVDQVAMSAAIEGGGVAVGVLAEPLTRTVRDPALRRAITAGSLCLFTPYKPSAAFSVAAALGRNKLIYALSTAALVVTSDREGGGTWAGAVEALARMPVLVWMGRGAGAGNAALVERGGIAVDGLDTLFPLDAHAARPNRAEQLSLEL